MRIEVSMSIEIQLPKDSMILLSYVNTQLRDFYLSLDEMCIQLNINKNDIIEKLRVIDYEYDETLNKFV